MAKASKIVTHLQYQAHSVETRNIVLNLCEENPDAKLLDVGCRDGEITLEVAERIGTKMIWGIDVVEDSLAKARAKGIQAVAADLNQPLPLESESFDVVHAANIIEHLYNTDSFLREIHRILKVGGYSVISTGNLASLHNIFFLLLGRQPPGSFVSDEVAVGTWSSKAKPLDSSGPGHQRIFTLKALKGLLEWHGLKVERSVGAGFYPFPIALARVLCRIDKRHSAYISVKARKTK